MDIYNKPSPEEYLAHHGILGMKWGVRRYQNYDGSYTQRGLERYRKASQAHESAKKKVKQTKEAYKRGWQNNLCKQYSTQQGNRIKKFLNALDYKNFQWNSCMHSCKCEYGYSTGKY